MKSTTHPNTFNDLSSFLKNVEVVSKAPERHLPLWGRGRYVFAAKHNDCGEQMVFLSRFLVKSKWIIIYFRLFSTQTPFFPHFLANIKPWWGVLRGERAAHGLRGGGRQPRQVAPRHRLRHSQVISDSLLCDFDWSVTQRLVVWFVTDFRRCYGNFFCCDDQKAHR